MSTRIRYAATVFLAMFGNAARPAKATIISDATRRSASSQTGDLHDVTGHHRYYGASACV